MADDHGTVQYDPSGPVIAFVRGKHGELRLLLETPGAGAVSAPLNDGRRFLLAAAEQIGFDVDDSDPRRLVVTTG